MRAQAYRVRGGPEKGLESREGKAPLHSAMMTNPAAASAGETILSRVARLAAPPFDLPGLLRLLDEDGVLRDELCAPETSGTPIEGHVLLGAALWAHLRSLLGADGVGGARPGPLNVREFGRHLLATACAAEWIARETDSGAAPAQAFLAGVMHDVGKAALSALLPRSYARVVGAAAAQARSLTARERALLGADHLQAGLALARAWRLPAWLTNCIGLHHHPPELIPGSIAARRLVRIVQLADGVARELHLGDAGNDAEPEPIGAPFVEWGSSRGQLEELLSALPQSVREREAAFGLSNERSERVAAGRGADGSRRGEGGGRPAQRAQAEMIAAIEELQAACAPGAPIEAVCGGCARVLRRAAGAGDVDVVVATMPDERGEVAAAVAGPRGLSTFTMRVAFPAERTWIETIATVDAGMLRMGTAEGEYLQRLVERLGAGVAVRAGLLRDGEDAIGVVLLGGAPGAVARGSDVLRRRAVVLREATRTLGAAWRVREAAALADALLDAARRLHDSRGEETHARAMEMVAEMAGGAAHELNNPLTVISGRAQMLLGSTGDEILLKHARIIHQQAHRASLIVSELMDFAHPAAPRPHSFDVCALVRDLTALARERAAVGGIDVRLELPEPALRVFADPVHVRTVVQNLLTNALEANEPGSGSLEINCHRIPSDDTVVIAIRDHGRGMDAGILRKAFDPFFSHRPAGRGRGMGLSLAYRLAQINSGRLEVVSAAGEGTMARLTLPARAQASPATS